MATLKQFKTNFVAGELDPMMIGRPDIKHYHNAARRMRNVVAIPQGGFTTRPGSTYLAKLLRMNGSTSGAVSNVRLAGFQYTTDEAYLFAFTDFRVQIFYQGSAVATLTTPYSSADLIAQFGAIGQMLSSGINWTQTLDQMIVYHEKYAPQIIKRGNSHSTWTIEAATFLNMPRVDFGDVTYTNGVDEWQELAFPYRVDSGANWQKGDTFVLVLEDEETESISMPDPAASGSAGVLAGRIQDALRALPNVDPTGVLTVAYSPGSNVRNTGFRVEFYGPNGSRPWGLMGYRVISSIEAPNIALLMIQRGEYPGEDAVSNARGWPRCGVFFQGRHWMAGSKSLPNTVWATRAATDWDLNNKKTTDDYGFMYSADTDEVPAFLNIYPGRHLQLFASTGEFYVPVSEAEGVTPKNMVLRRTTSRGSKPGLRLAEVDGATVFVQWGGKALREFIFADTEEAYQANSISLLASHLMLDPLSLTLRRASSTDDADLLFMPNGDGSMSVFCTLRTQEVNAMTLWTTDGSYRDVCPLYDDVFLAAERTINGQTDVYLELMNEEISIDCARVQGASSSATLAWLPNTRVDIMLDGAVQQQNITNGGGAIAFERAAVEQAIIGLPWPEVAPEEYPGFRWLVETLPVDAELQDGTMFGRKRRIVWVAFRLFDTNGLMVNKSRVAMRRYGGNLLDKPNPRTSGVKTLKGILGYDYEGKVTFGETTPTQSTVLALSWAVSV